MKYDVEIEIDLPRERVVELFSDPDNMAKWQAGLVSFELLDGELGQPGTTSKLRYKMSSGSKNRTRDVAMTETIVKKRSTRSIQRDLRSEQRVEHCRVSVRRTRTA